MVRMRLVVFHFHDRPGGVREVIQRGLSQLVERLGNVHEVVFLAGELTDAAWREQLRDTLQPVPLTWVEEPECGYAGEHYSSLSNACQKRLGELFTPLGKSPDRSVVWAHNLSVGRNVPLLRTLPLLCSRAGAELWLHHHDWWWDGRWARWRDWQAAGVHDLSEALAASVPVGPDIRHFCVNAADFPFLRDRAGAAASWVGNPLPPFPPPTGEAIRTARQWLTARTGGRPVWLAPVRALRRKNLAESLLLTRILAPHAILVTTGGCSADEAPSWRKLRLAALTGCWPLVPSALSDQTSATPSVAALMMCSEAVVISSLQEGFGLPLWEAAALGRPVISRTLPQGMGIPATPGCSLTTGYDNFPVPSERFDAAAEWSRRKTCGREMRSLLPSELRSAIDGCDHTSLIPEAGGSRPRQAASMDFGRLSLDAQLQVLSGPLTEIALNPVPQPPNWPGVGGSGDWADRMMSTGAAVVDAETAEGSLETLRKELGLRLDYWLDHPLLWPASSGS